MIEGILSVAIAPIDESNSKINQIEETPPDDNEAASEADGEILESNEPPHKRRKLSDTDVEKVIMGEELSDIHVNLAQRLLQAEFPDLNGLLSTL